MMAAPKVSSYYTAKREKVVRKNFIVISEDEVKYLNLCGLPMNKKASLDGDTGSSLAYLHLAGFLTQLILASDFRSYYDMFIELKLSDCFDMYQDVVVQKYKEIRQPRILEVYVDTCRRFERCETRSQRKRIFDRVLDNLFETNCEDVTALKTIVDIMHSKDETLREVPVTSMPAVKLNYFLIQLKKIYPHNMVSSDKSVQNPLQTLLDHEECGPIHRCFAEGSATNLAVMLNHGFEQKISPNQLQWYIKSILTRKRDIVYDQNFQFWHNYLKSLQVYDSNKIFRRLFLTFQLLYVIMHKMDTKHRRCLRLIWKTLPDNYITAEELELVTKELPVRKKMVKSYEAFISTDWYAEVKSYINRPRELRHYCRYQIRTLLRQNNQLPDGIANLGLPVVLQSFMLLESSGIDTNFMLK